MNTERRMSLAEGAGWGLAVAALGALGALWHFDRSRVWERPRWDDPGLVVLRTADGADDRAGRMSRMEQSPGAERAKSPVETWAVAVHPGCALCRASLARAAPIRRLAETPVRLGVLVVDTPRRPISTTLASYAADELRWDSTGAWRRRWGHRIYGELLCFDRSGRFVRTLTPLGDSLAVQRALRIGESLRDGRGS